jgi:hypothetical protein
MTRKLAVLLLVPVMVIVFASCGSDEGPNLAPDTEIVSGPNPGSNHGYRVPIEWSGSDPDGRVVSYETAWYSGPLDGGDLDTLLTWEATKASADTFDVLADSGCGGASCYHAHSFFVRAVDNDGAKDPSPASVSFTATTTEPRSRIIYPVREQSVLDAQAPTCVKIRWEGTDQDGEAVEFRVARKAYMDAPEGEPPPFNDPTRWGPWSTDTEIVVWPLNPVPGGQGWSFYVQARDNAGAVETDFSTTRNHIRIFVQEDWKNIPNVQISCYRGPCYLKSGALIDSRSTAGDTTMWDVPVVVDVGDTVCFRTTFSPGAYATVVKDISFLVNDPGEPTYWDDAAEEENWDYPSAPGVFIVSPGLTYVYAWVRDDYCVYGSPRRVHMLLQGESAN